jgi:hypothetical protein
MMRRPGAPGAKAGDPDDRGGARRLDARAKGRGGALQRPLPGDALKIVARVPTRKIKRLHDADPCLLSPASALERIADSSQTSRQVRNVPISEVTALIRSRDRRVGSRARSVIHDARPRRSRRNRRRADTRDEITTLHRLSFRLPLRGSGLSGTSHDRSPVGVILD